MEISAKSANNLTPAVSTSLLRVPAPLLWISWTLATSIGGLLGWCITVTAGMGTMGIGLIFAGTIVGLCVGGAQYLALVATTRGVVAEKRPFNWGKSIDWEWYRSTFRWVGLTSLGGTVSFLTMLLLFASVLSLPLPLSWKSLLLSFNFAIGGALFGLLQYHLLQRKVPKAGWWVLANAAGWGAGAEMGVALADNVHQSLHPGDPLGGGMVIGPNDYLHLLILGSIATLVLAIVTGTVLTLLLYLSDRETRRLDC